MREILIALIVLSTILGCGGAVSFAQDGTAKLKKAVKEELTDDFTYNGKGKRDPFTPPGKGGGGAEEMQNLKVDGVISDENGISAVISGEVVKEGDKIFGAEVKKITKDSVILEYEKTEDRIECRENGGKRVSLKGSWGGDEKNEGK